MALLYALGLGGVSPLSESVGVALPREHISVADQEFKRTGLKRVSGGVGGTRGHGGGGTEHRRPSRDHGLRLTHRSPLQVSSLKLLPSRVLSRAYGAVSHLPL